MLILAGFLQACGGGSSGTPQPPPPAPTETRSFELGFTPWPYDATANAVNFVYSEAAQRGDFIAHHLDAGVPWEEALNGLPYSAELEAELTTRLNSTPVDMKTYLALSPLNGARNGLAEYWGTAANQPLPAPWDALTFDDPDVVAAYTNFATDLIQRFDPAYFNLGIEVSELAINDIAAYDRLVTFTAAVSGALKSQFPDVQLMISVALKSPSSAEAATIRSELPRIVQHIDVVGVSVYPYIFFDHADRGDPRNLPADWLSQVTTLAGGKPVAIAETGWAAERVTIPAFGVDIDSTAANQEDFLDTLFPAAELLDAQFIVWFSLVDFDALWNGALGQDPVARIWRDTGLYDEALNPRPALDTWMNQLDLPVE
ncbi:MAG: glycosyl hydrolase 53 family protein [Woeseiaceae bacterium]|nr:glycosyl hydrolase 53 family protein [Woeseiaceae bacterium]